MIRRRMAILKVIFLSSIFILSSFIPRQMDKAINLSLLLPWVVKPSKVTAIVRATIMIRSTLMPWQRRPRRSNR